VAFEDRPTHRKYARIERERRFLLDALPDTLALDDYERLHDLYIADTHLRLRRVHRADGVWITSKLGQKIVAPDAPDDSRQRQMTTIYLTEAETEVFARLPGLGSVKRRHKLLEQGRTFCIDVWELPHGAAGTMVAEVETESLAELEAIRRPAWAVAEVTDDNAYSAISLARRM
jgi:CYTH domain-containing protein